MTNKELYAIWIKNQTHVPIFMQPWWMDAVCAGKQWDVFLFFAPDKDKQNNEEGSEAFVESIIAGMPYLIRNRFKMRYILMPQLTPIGGVWIDQKICEDAQSNNELLLFIYHKLRDKLNQQNLHYYYQQYPILSPIIPFIDRKEFKIKERRTYRIDKIENLDSIIDGFSKNVKRQLQKSLSLHIDWNVTAEEFFTFHIASLREKKRDLIYTREFFLVLQQKSYKLQRSSIIAVRNQDNEIVAAVFVVWDDTSLYYLIPSYSEHYKNSGGSALLILEAIKLAKSKGLSFDFEGSSIANIAQFYKQFASTPTSYYSVEKIYKPYFRFALIYNWIKNRKYAL